jgi:hypothetical protein
MLMKRPNGNLIQFARMREGNFKSSGHDLLLSFQKKGRTESPAHDKKRKAISQKRWYEQG